MKKVYFAGSIRGGRDDAEHYKRIIDFMMKLGGWTVLTEHLGLKSLKAMGEEGHTERWIYDRDIAWLREADVIVAEVTKPSLGVGYEIGRAEEWGKPILCLFRHSEDQRLSAMIAGNPQLTVVEYTGAAEAEAAIADFLKKL